MVEEGTFRPKIKKPDEEISEIYTALKYFKQGEFVGIGGTGVKPELLTNTRTSSLSFSFCFSIPQRRIIFSFPL